MLSYGFDLIRPEMLEHAQLAERLRRTVFDLQTQFRSGWNMFDPPYRRGVQARFVLDPMTGDEETDFLEAAWLRARNPGEMAEFWRVSPRGLATIIRPYAEDVDRPDADPPIHPGRYLSPICWCRRWRNSSAMPEPSPGCSAGCDVVTFRGEWWGLAGRELFDPERPLAASRTGAGRSLASATVQVPLPRLYECLA